MSWIGVQLGGIRIDRIGCRWIGLSPIPIELDSIESNQIELEWTGLSAVHWMLFCHGLGEFPIVGFPRFGDSNL